MLKKPNEYSPGFSSSSEYDFICANRYLDRGFFNFSNFVATFFFEIYITEKNWSGCGVYWAQTCLTRSCKQRIS